MNIYELRKMLVFYSGKIIFGMWRDVTIQNLIYFSIRKRICIMVIFLPFTQKRVAESGGKLHVISKKRRAFRPALACITLYSGQLTCGSRRNFPSLRRSKHRPCHCQPQHIKSPARSCLTLLPHHPFSSTHDHPTAAFSVLCHAPPCAERMYPQT